MTKSNAQTFTTVEPMLSGDRDRLHESGWKMVHICWPTKHYHYVFQKPGAPKGKCEHCKRPYSLKFPTTGRAG